MAPESSFGRWLRWRRRLLDLTQEDLARQVGCSVITIRKLESDERQPSLQIAERLALCLAGAAEDRAAIVRYARGGVPPEQAVVPAHSSSPSLTGNLPAPLTPLLGRSQDVAAISNRLLSHDQRLITLIGPPGIGKTRLAIAAAHEVRCAFAGGAFFVSLAPLRDPALVVTAVARLIGANESDSQPPVERVSLHLRSKQLLLVLDNMEQVVEAAPVLSQWLEECQGLKILVTSRAALRLRGEQRYPVPPLLLPSLGGHLAAGDMLRSPAVSLFVDRARAVRPDFVLSDDDAPVVAEICHRLDGLPLAIELVAARVNLFSPQALRARLDHRFELVSGGGRDLPPRQQTLWNAIDWSYQLLDEQHQRLFVCLGLFEGGWTIPAAAAIFRAAVPESFDVTEGIAALIDQSLVAQQGGCYDEPRFTMLETLREFAVERLAGEPYMSAVYAAFAQYYEHMVQTAQPELHGPCQARWLQRLELEQPNLRAVLSWAVAHNQALGLRLASLLIPFWIARGSISEGRRWLSILLEQPGSLDSDPIYARALCGAGLLAFQQGDLTQAQSFSERSLVLFRHYEDANGIAWALSNLGNIARERNSYATANVLLQEALSIYRTLGDVSATAQVLKGLGLIAKDQGDYALAIRFLNECLALQEELGDRQGMGWSLFNLGVVAFWQAEYEQAQALLEQSRCLHLEQGNQMGVAYALESLGMTLLRRGDPSAGKQLLDESLSLMRALGDTIGIALLLTDLGCVLQAQGDSEGAAAHYRNALTLAWQIGDKRRIAFCLEGVAAALGNSNPQAAARLWGAAEELRKIIAAPLPPSELPDYQQYLAALRSRLSAAEFAASWEAGRAQPLAQIVSEELQVRATYP